MLCKHADQTSFLDNSKLSIPLIMPCAMNQIMKLNKQNNAEFRSTGMMSREKDGQFIHKCHGNRIHTTIPESKKQFQIISWQNILWLFCSESC